ncbi:MAG: hypothetical protein ACFFDN_43445 [Candidatus Hodarchaeota archaeon]
MKWIYSLKELKHLLDEDEEILWLRKETKNLMSLILFSIKAEIFFILFIIVAITIVMILGSIIGVVIILSLGIVGVVYVIIITVKGYRNRMEATQLNREELKEYDFFYIITNKRYIRKDYYYHEKRDFSKYPKNSFEKIGDTVFLHFDWIDLIIVDFVLKEINFKIKDFPEGRAFFLGFKEKDEMEKVMEIIQNVIPLEISEKKVDDYDTKLYTKYIKKEK